MFYLLIIFLPVVVILIAWFYYYWNVYRHLKSIPTPPLWPLIGNGLEFKSTKGSLDKIKYFFDKYNTKVLRLHLGFKTLLVIKDCKFLEFLLTSTTILDKSIGYFAIEPWLGMGLVTTIGEKWKKTRKMINPSFHFQILKQFVDIFNSKSKILIKKLEEQKQKDCLDIYPFVTLCALDIICESIMGISVNVQDGRGSAYAETVNDMCELVVIRSLNPLLHFDFIFKLTKYYKRQCKNLEILHGQSNLVIKQRREALANKTLNEKENKFGLKKNPFLDTLLQSTIDGKPLSDEDIREEVDTFMLAGYDTVATAMSFTLFLLANHPEVQKKVIEEIKSIFQDDKIRNVTYEDLQEMKYLEMVIKESLRIYPPSPFYVRSSKEDIHYNGMTIPKNVVLGIYAYGIHRDPENYENPDKFNPERFSNKEMKPFTFLAFSAGPRNCIGQKFAMLELKTVITNILRHFELKPTIPEHKMIIVPEIVLKSTNGMLVKLETRQ